MSTRNANPVVVCDNCGVVDDANYGDGPVFVEGASIHFRNHNAETVEKSDLCSSCTEQLLKLLPQLAKSAEHGGWDAARNNREED